MDLCLLLVTEPSSSSHQHRAARRSLAMRPISTGRTQSTDATLDSTATRHSISSSFSYTPLPDDYYSREAEYDYAAAHDYLNCVDGASEADESEISSLDYLGTGTPLFTPQLMAKILQAKAAGRPLRITNSNVGEGRDKAQRKLPSNGRNRSVSIASPAVSRGHQRLQGGERAGVRDKRSREDESDDQLYDSDASNATAHEPPLKRLKGWKGWALVEVSSLEDDTPGAKLYDEEGRRISTKPQSHNAEEASGLDSEAERVKSNPGWKGALIVCLTTGSPFASVSVPQPTNFPLIISLYSVGQILVKDPSDRSKLIKLDAPPLILTTRATRSGRMF
ncbi:hypothetical protein M407DRAFT_33527 [Tulasnella calospora MUT 4182]|uniref:Uncharacterized protein n=1 Tax=Tulasnella calospora MUT 4182 TaxID=1051891 RepID=A0A0C3Q2V7_9AGAM|nr:hypothetical protein M407DRAFT_33527 [Tulasnella calospora MUT 4182]